MDWTKLYHNRTYKCVRAIGKNIIALLSFLSLPNYFYTCPLPCTAFKRLSQSALVLLIRPPNVFQDIYLCARTVRTHGSANN